MKATEELAWLNEVSSVPLEQAIRHQQAACTAFFAGRARYPRFKWSWPADFLHKASTSLLRDHDVIVLEDLAVTNMVRNRRLAKTIADCGQGTLRAMLGYKTARYERRVIVIDWWYPSTKTCSACRYLLATLDLKTRTWPCPSCGTRHDRDHNAANNILAAGLAVAGGDPASPPPPTAARRPNEVARRPSPAVPA